MLEDFTFQSSFLNEVPKSIKYVSSTIYLLDLAGNCITTLKNMENIVFRNLARIYLMQNRVYHLNHVFTTTGIVIYKFIWKQSYSSGWYEYVSMGFG